MGSLFTWAGMGPEGGPGGIPWGAEPGEPEPMETVELPVGGPETPASLLTLPGEWEWWETQPSPPSPSGEIGPGPME